MEIQPPNLSTFSRADYKIFQQMSDNDDQIKSSLESAPRGIIALGLLDNIAANLPNYSGTFSTYQPYNSVNWIPANLLEPKTNSRLTVNFEANRSYKFIVHLDYVWAANNFNTADTGETGRIEVRLRDMTHRHDLIYWTNVVNPDYNMGGLQSGQYAVRDIVSKANVNIWAWDQSAARGTVPGSCHAVRAMAAKSSGASILSLQYRPMNAYGGIVPPEFMDCSGGQPIIGLPTQYKNTAQTFNTEAIKQFKGYVIVEDCGIVEKPAGVEPGVQNDNSVSPLFESYDNHPYDSTAPGRP